MQTDHYLGLGPNCHAGGCMQTLGIVDNHALVACGCPLVLFFRLLYTGKHSISRRFGKLYPNIVEVRLMQYIEIIL